MDADTVINRNSGMIAVSINREIAIMNVENGDYYVTNEMGAAIWELLEKCQTIKSITKSIQDRFRLSEGDDPESDVREFLNEMLSENLIIKPEN